MNKIVTTLMLTLFVSVYAFAQITHTVDGKQYDLNQEITGNASFFYTTIDGEYRYFIKKNGEITELTNTKDSNGKYQEEYKEILSILTADAAMDISKVNLTLGSLRTYIDEYNKVSDINYRMQAERPKAKARVGGFVGMSNNPFVKNQENTLVPTFGAELELYDEKRTRHSLAIGFKQSLEAEEFKYMSSQFAINYRLRIINKERFSIYPQAKLATYTFSSTEVTLGTSTTKTISGSSFDAPIILGLGIDIKLGNGFVTLMYDEIAGVFIDSQGNTPVDFRLGYKFNL